MQKQTNQVSKPKNKDNRKEPKLVQPVCFLSEQMLGMSERENERSVVGRLWVVNFPFLFYNEHMLLLLYYVFFLKKKAFKNYFCFSHHHIYIGQLSTPAPSSGNHAKRY